jgi:lysyl-tRNA synthetase class 2
MLLNTLKESSALSGKKWDKAIKEITQHGLAKVEKIDDILSVKIV